VLSRSSRSAHFLVFSQRTIVNLSASHAKIASQIHIETTINGGKSSSLANTPMNVQKEYLQDAQNATNDGHDLTFTAMHLILNPTRSSMPVTDVINFLSDDLVPISFQPDHKI
jgi:hypothetical protein